MRVRTDIRREAILQVAAEAFREVGYSRASMAMISTRLGGSKGTIYGYFKSKEELFAAAMKTLIVGQARNVVDLLKVSDGDLRSILQKFGEAYLDMLTSSDAIAIMRTAIAEGGNSSLGSTLYVNGTQAAWEEMSGHLERYMEKGLLRDGDPLTTATHLKGLLEAGTIEPLLFGAEPWADRQQAVATAVDIFLRAYGCA